MLPEIETISRIRRALRITQKELEKKSGVSQSSIAKIEAGKLDPSYSNAIRLFNALEEMQRHGEKTARDLMNHNVAHLRKEDAVFNAIKFMKERGISQLPILDAHNKIIGSISEKGILSGLDLKPSINLKKIKIRDLMEDPYPTVSEKTPATTISHMLRDSLAVIVVRGDKMVGIITKSDLLKSV
jgi:predicted transcriptional regulator